MAMDPLMKRRVEMLLGGIELEDTRDAKASEWSSAESEIQTRLRLAFNLDQGMLWDMNKEVVARIEQWRRFMID